MSLALVSPQRDEHLLPDRKHRLLACGLCRQFAPLVNRPELLSVLEMSETAADGLATVGELSRARQFALEVARTHAASSEQEKFALAVALTAAVVLPSSRSLYKTVEPATAGQVSRLLASVAAFLESDDALLPLPAVGYAGLFDDVRPRRVRFAPEWRTDTVIGLARQMYESREFSAMPILADALQDAGCDNEGMLFHCRDASQPHIRGCWVVDAVLEKQ